MTAAHSAGRRQNGPPLGPLAVVVTVLFTGGLVVSIALSGGRTYPSPFGDPEALLDYFCRQSPAVLALGSSQFAAAVPLAIYAATASARLRTLGVRAPGATIALAGGLIAAAMLALSGLVDWVLSRPEVAEQDGVVRALHDLAFATGGVGYVVFSGLLVAGIAVPSLLLGLLPRTAAWSGLVIAAVATVSTVVLLVTAAGFLLPVARFAGLVWLIYAGFALPRSRAARSDGGTDSAAVSGWPTAGRTR